MSEDEPAEKTASDNDSDSDAEQSDSPVDEETLEAAKEKVASVEQRYEPGSRPTVVVEGTDGTVAGTAFASEEQIEKHQSEMDDGKDEDEDDK